MRIAVIGAGNVGATLGRRLATAGHTVTYGVRDPEGERAQAAVAATPEASAATVAVATHGAEVVVLAVPGVQAVEVAAGLEAPEGAILVDATNPIGLELEASGAEAVAAAAPSVRVVKAFNNVGYEIMADPAFGERRAVTLVCGDDDDARSTVTGLAAAIGFEPLDIGELANADLAEGFAMTWITLALRRGYGRNIAFTLLRR